MHQQAASSPLDHQGSPPSVLLKEQHNSQNSDCHHVERALDAAGSDVHLSLVAPAITPGGPVCTSRKGELVMGWRFPRGVAGQRRCYPRRGIVQRAPSLEAPASLLSDSGDLNAGCNLQPG